MKSPQPCAFEVLTEILRCPDSFQEIPFDAIPGILAQIAAVQSIIAARLIESTGRREPSCPTEGGRLLTVEETAQRLGVTPDWLYRRTGRLPFTVRLGRALRFSQDGLDRWIRNKSGK